MLCVLFAYPFLRDLRTQIEDAKEYQKNSWAEAKLQLLRLKAKFIKN